MRSTRGIAALLLALAIGSVALVNPAAGQGQSQQARQQNSVEPPPVPAPIDPAPEDIEAPTDHREYAKVFGVSESEALRRQELRTEVGAIIERLADEHPDQFAGFEVVHSPNYKFEVWLVGRPNPQAQRLLNEARGLGLPVVGVPGHRVSMRDLMASGEELVAELRPYGTDGDVYVVADGKNGRLDVTVSQVVADRIASESGPTAGPGNGRAGEVLSALQERLPQARGIEVALSVTDAVGDVVSYDAWVHGGSWLGGVTSQTQHCRTAFTVYMWTHFPGVGWFMSNGLLTAAHCQANVGTSSGLTDYAYRDHGTTYNGQSHLNLYYWGHTFNQNHGDLMVVETRDNPTATYRPYGPDNTPRWNVTSEVGWSDYAVGDWFCAWSRHTLVRSCAQVENPYAMDANGMAWLVQMDRDLLDFGDSGAPWSFSGKAAGVHTGSVEFGKDVFSRIADRYTIGNVYLYTN